MHDVKQMKDLKNSDLLEVPQAPEPAAPPAPEVAPFVHCEVQPLPAGAAIALAAAAADGDGEDRMIAGLNVTQAREMAARLLMCADMACGGSGADQATRTILVITPARDWVPGQCLQVRYPSEDKPHFQMLLDTRPGATRPGVAVPGRKKLILPGQ